MAYDYYLFINSELNKYNIINQNSLMILSADHGERFYEHNSWVHGPPDIYNEVIHIPLMFKGKGVKKGIYSQNVQLADVFPTIMDWLGDEVLHRLVGKSLIKNINGDLNNNRVIYSDGANRIKQFSFIKNNIKVIVNDKDIKIYDIINDPKERNNLYKKRKFKSLIKEALNFRKKNKQKLLKNRKNRTMSPKMLKRLKTLGYIE
jgi:arylsulfatase A-like enzyme